jgi:hypothetical protein
MRKMSISTRLARTRRVRRRSDTLRENFQVIAWIIETEANYLEQNGNPVASPLVCQTVGRQTTSADFWRSIALWLKLAVEEP